MFPQSVNVALGNKNVTSISAYAIDLETILKHIHKVLPNYLSIPSVPDSNIWYFYDFLKICPIIFNNTLEISIIMSIVDNTFHMQLYQLHIGPVVNNMLNQTIQI